jgi:methylated-DNA-[protein]-cysteine S-methyltransferase
MDSPIGPLLLVADDQGLRRLGFQAGPHPLCPDPEWRLVEHLPGEVETQLAEYFAGRRQRFEIHLAPQGTTFQQAVWTALREVTYGTTVSYGELARRLGRPTAARAVGAANGANPLPILIPCHRVIGSLGKLTGFGGGLAIKEILLALERRHAAVPGKQLELL